MPTPSGAGGDAAADRITAWVAAAKAGDRGAAESLYEAVYDELRRIARAQRSRRAAARGRSGDTMSTTVVVHELYLRLARAESLTVADRNHFFSLAARVMRQILIDAARRAIARGGLAPRVELDADGLVAPERPRELLALDEALDRLAEQDGTSLSWSSCTSSPASPSSASPRPRAAPSAPCAANGGGRAPSSTTSSPIPPERGGPLAADSAPLRFSR